MSEEVRNASTDVPRSMLMSLGINGTLAVGLLLAVLFSATDIEQLLIEESPLSPFIRIFRSAVGSSAGATIMVSIIIALEFCSAMGCLAAASRMTWSFARDRGLPFSRALSLVSSYLTYHLRYDTYSSQIDKRTTIPVVAILVVTVLSALLSLINIGNSAAFNGTISLVLEGFYLSYLLAIGLLFWRRIRGDLDCQNADLAVFNTSPLHDEAYDRSLTWGPWRMKGSLGVANNAIAICYLMLIIFFSFWPTHVNPTPEMMNWAVVVTGGVASFSVIYYVMVARKSYTGPIVEIDPHAI